MHSIWGCSYIALRALSLGLVAASANCSEISSRNALEDNSSDFKRDEESVDFTSIDLLPPHALEQRQDWRGESVSLHPDVLLPISSPEQRVKFNSPGLRLDRIYDVRHQPEKIALILTNTGKPLRPTLLVVTLTGPGAVRTLYGSMPGFPAGVRRRLLLSASTPIANQRLTIQLRPWGNHARPTAGKEDRS